jgi:hypothetical protein
MADKPGGTASEYLAYAAIERVMPSFAKAMEGNFSPA